MRTLTCLLLLVVVLVAAVPAKADTIFQLTVDNCTGGCNPGAPGTSMGTVNLHTVATGDVKVTITLVSPLQFVNTGLVNTIDFNITGSPAITANTFSNANFSLSSGTAGSNHFDGLGNFAYTIQLNTAQGAGGAVNASPLSFDILAAGLTDTSFSANSQGFFFGVDVYNPTRNTTGPIGTSGGVTTPEPSSMLMLGLGMLGLGLSYRKLVSQRG